MRYVGPGEVTGKGVSANLREHTLRAFLMSMVLLVVEGGAHFQAMVFGMLTVQLRVVVHYRKLAPISKWLALFYLLMSSPFSWLTCREHECYMT